MTYGLAYKTKELPELTDKSRILLLRAYFLHDSISNVEIVVSINENGENSYYKSYNLQSFLKIKNKWEKVELMFQLPKVNSEAYDFAIFIRNKGKTELFIDDFGFKMY